MVVKLLKHAGGKKEEKSSGQVITVLLLILLVFAAVHVYRTRKTSTPPKWMGSLETATSMSSFKLGVLLLRVFPIDIITAASVGTHLARNGDPWSYSLPFVFATLFLKRCRCCSSCCWPSGRWHSCRRCATGCRTTRGSSARPYSCMIAIEINSLVGS